MPQTRELKLATKANQLRSTARWEEAISAYQQLDKLLPSSAEISHNMAICLLGSEQSQEALICAKKALTLKPDLWQSHLIKAKAERKLDLTGESAAKTLTSLIQSRPLEKDIQAHARLDLAELELNVFCNAKASLEWIKPSLNTPGFEERAQLTSLIARLYDRSETDKKFNQEAITFARRFLEQKPASQRKPAKRALKRKRIGLLSPMFHVGPLYFLTFESFKLLAQSHDLIFFSRGRKKDWASEKFQSIASEWINCKSFSWQDLGKELLSAELDILFELGGWMDTDGLKAASLRPAPKQYKWVGGQAMTTGLTCFDGFLSDIWQTPKETEHLFTEPLILLPDGYVRYTPPDYFLKRKTKKSPNTLAIIGNPPKITERSAKELQKLYSSKSKDAPDIQELRLIDRRYSHPKIKSRMENLFSRFPGKLTIIACDGHEEFLKEVSRVQYVLDTAPYSAGLTAREALTLGATLLTPGKNQSLFANRHGYAANRAFTSNPTPAPLDLAALI